MMRNLLIALLLVLTLQPGDLYAAEAEVSISDAVKKFAESSKRIRIAVFDFANTAGNKTRFDTYIADMLVSELSKYPLTLLERKRLEVLLAEHALSQSGVIDPGKALKLGELLPVDIVVSGSYTELSGRLVIHGRFIHVGTGEIHYAFTSSIEATVEPARPAEPGKIVCEPSPETVRKALYTLNDRTSVARAVDLVLPIPFDTGCGVVHYEVMRTFVRNKIFDDRYRVFLLRTLRALETPSDDNRAVEIMRFFAADRTVDREEWEAGLEALQKMRITPHSIALRPLLNAEHEKSATVRERVDEIMRLAAENRIGRPVPVQRETMFFAVLHGLDAQSGRTDARNAVAVLRAYSGYVPDDDVNNKRAAELLQAIYSHAQDREAGREALALLIEFYQQRTATDKLAEGVADLVRSLEAKAEERQDRDKANTVAAREDLVSVSASLADLYCRSIATAKRERLPYIVEERSLFVLRQGVRCDQVPSVKDLEAEMRSGEWDRKLKAVETLSKIGEAAKGAERTVIRYLGQQGFGSQGGDLRRFCAAILGNIRTKDPEGITLLIASFPEFDRGVSHEAQEAIKKIGIDAFPYLIQGLGSKDHAIRLRCVTALGYLGSKAKKALPDLQTLAEKDVDPYVRKEAAGVVQMIKNDF
jgi:TolB-like protein